MKWIIMIAVAAASVVTTISMKRRIKGNQGASAGHTNTGSVVSGSIMESVRSEGSDRDTPASITSEYDVFLSFRGPDARHRIADHLYQRMTEAGLRVFKDDEEIRRGEVIGGELERAIRSSRVYAVVFSRNYASSAWCLRELDMMVDLCGGSNDGGKIILPIFYGADSADVKLRTELYREALNAHKDRHGQDVVKKWEEALKTVGGISGWDSKAIQGEGRFVQIIAQDIFGKLRIKDKSLPDLLIGIDDHVSNMLNRLDCNSSGLRLVVLHGMGGIGKTTLARVIFNKLSSQFEGSSFISNVRESFTGHGGTEKLQNKLSRDILGGQYASCNFDDGFGEIIQRIRGKRMLLVLDDVDQFSQLEKLVGKDLKDKLGTGSRVIITTRDKSVCMQFVRPGSELLYFYEMEKMDDNHAFQLFSRRAFGTDEPPQDYISLSKKVVKTTGNLPLALVVIAGHLCCQSQESWKHELEKLKKIPHKEVFKILKVSYDGLEWREKEIFLDIACFREAMHRRYVDYFWNARDLYPESGVKILINKSLIKIDSVGQFWIHGQLRDMGREIIRSEGLGRPEMCTRLWDPNDALKIVLQKKVSEKIIAMDLDLGSDEEEHEFSDEDFRGIFNLLYLHLKGTHQFIGDFGSIRETLMWLSWRNCNQRWNRDIFKMSNLVVLEIEGRWWGVEKLIMPKLRVLVVWGSDMRKTPDVSYCLKLVIMVFGYFENLEEIHHSVGKLKSLTCMKISHCRSLRSLPEELCCARALQELIVTDCKIEEVPESIGSLESLRTLDLRRNNIKRLPASICYLENLQVLHIADNPLDIVNLEEIRSLSTLEDLDLSWSNIRLLWGVSQLTTLKSLYLNNCRMLQDLQGLPTSLMVLEVSHCPLKGGISEEIGSLSALERLDLSYSEIRFLPATVRRLTSLKSLKLNCCRMLQEVRGLPTSLTELDASYCPLNEGIQEEIGNLSALEELDLSYTNIGFLQVSQLTSLKSLKLNCCRMLREVRGLPTSLTFFSFSSDMDMVGLSEEIRCTKQYVKRKITFWGGFQVGFLSRLMTLCWSFPDMASLQTYLEISDFTLTEMELGGLDSLRNLTELSISSSGNLLRVSNIGRLRRGLRSLTFSWCGALIEIPGLEQLEMLEELRLHRCHSICGIQDLLGLKRLKVVTFHDCSSLLSVPHLIDECRLWISCCQKLQPFEGPYSEYEGESSKSA